VRDQAIRFNIHGQRRKDHRGEENRRCIIRGGVTMAIYIPPVRKGACDSAVIWASESPAGFFFARWKRGAATFRHATNGRRPQPLASQGAEASARPVDLREARLARRKSLVGMRGPAKSVCIPFWARSPVDHQDCGGVRGTGRSVANFLIGDVGTNFDD
jgi:hypothetical protein